MLAAKPSTNGAVKRHKAHLVAIKITDIGTVNDGTIFRAQARVALVRATALQAKLMRRLHLSLILTLKADHVAVFGSRGVFVMRRGDPNTAAAAQFVTKRVGHLFGDQFAANHRYHGVIETVRLCNVVRFKHNIVQ